ncbi:MAG: dihydrodipicolinate synthase family protein [Chloroflexi bacterium]|nr:dihydrodipicolinate synthase family protein [Chloroflexota bacterium]
MRQVDLGHHLVPPVMIFHDDYSIDEAGFRRYLQKLLDTSGVSSLVMNAQAGEGDSLSTEERLRVLRIGLEEARGKAKIVATVSPSPDSTAAAIRIAADSADAGADAILLMPPRWFGGGVNLVPEVALEYVEAIARAVDIPLIIFQLNPTTWVHYKLDLLRRMCEIDNVIGIKSVTADVAETEDNVRALHSLPRQVRVYTGNDIIMFYDYLAGVDGTLLGNMNVHPRELIEMFDAVKRNDLIRAREIHWQLAPISRVLFALPHLSFRSRYKEAARMLGIIESATVRPPLPKVSGEEKTKIQQALMASRLEPEKVFA